MTAQPTIKDIRDEFTRYAMDGGALWFNRWLLCELVNARTRLLSAGQCINDLAGETLAR